MSYLLPHLRSGWAVDQAILAEEVRCTRLARARGRAARLRSARADAPLCARAQDRVVCMRFGHDYEETCMQMDEARRAFLCALRRQRSAVCARAVALGLRALSAPPLLTRRSAVAADARVHLRAREELRRHLCR
jgi:hypothetical protein